MSAHTDSSPTAARPFWFSSDARQKALAFGSLLVLLVVFSLLNPTSFLTKGNFIDILQSTAVNGVLAIACTFVIVTSGIDLSVGVLMTFCAVMAGVFLVQWGVPLPLGLLGAIVTGMLCGAVSGLVITQLRVPPFIATLGMMMLLRGLSLIITKTQPIYFDQIQGFEHINSDWLFSHIIPDFPLPNGVVILFVLAVVASLVLDKTLLGRYAVALGSNEEAARLSGVNVKLWKIIIYAFSGGICGIAGLIMASRVGSAQPALGQGYELEAIAAVVIGGTSLSGGRGSIMGSMIGAFIMSVLINGLRIISVAQEWQLVMIGVVIIAAVYADQLRHRNKT